MPLNQIGYYQPGSADDVKYVCPHCHRIQVIKYHVQHAGAVILHVKQCLSCRDVELKVGFVQVGMPHGISSPMLTLYPSSQARSSVKYLFAPPEVVGAYGEACKLYGLHVGAAGAYARRALELILDNLGYAKPTLAASIDLANKETDIDKRLPKRLLAKLDYVKEIGNFALHIRRGEDLTIVEIGTDEVEACLEIIEELVVFSFEEPGRDRARTEALNSKLKAAGKREIALPVEQTSPLEGPHSEK
ncbi:MAG: DUF4145 domain-containing protein [Alphaproteobacteria bacterium]|nr:DUF4145 domain-containing protein [Alphaproteobacteria bacterium]